MNEVRFAACYVAAVITAATLGLAACKDEGPPPDPHQPYATVVAIPAGTPVYAGPSPAAPSCGAFIAGVHAIVQRFGPGGWMGIDTDTYARGTDPVPRCLRLPIVWINAGNRAAP